jgi:hypothetical protein
VRTTPVLAALFVLILLAPLSVRGETPVADEPGAPKKSGPAEAKKAEPISPEMKRLVEQLGSADFRKRDEAEKRLREAGVKAVPALRQAVGHPNLEVRMRVRALLPQLENAAIVAPTRVTLSAKNQKVREVIADICKQTGYQIDANPSDSNATYDFEFKNTPFWQAIDQICQRAGMYPQHSYGEVRLRLYSNNRHPAFISYSGAFRFTPNNIHFSRSVDLSNVGPDRSPTRNESLAFSFTIFAEPKTPLLGLGQPQVTAAYDTEKNSMIVPVEGSNPNPFARQYISRYGSGRQLQMQTTVPLQRRSEKATGIKLLRGTLPVVLLTEEKPVTVTEDVLKAKGKKMTVGEITFTIEESKKLPGGQYQIKFTVKRDSKDNDYSWMNNLYQRVELRDAKGNKFQSWGSSWGNSGPNFATVTLTYRKPNVAGAGDPKKFIFQKWTTAHHLVTFEFKDLPLP